MRAMNESFTRQVVCLSRLSQAQQDFLAEQLGTAHGFRSNGATKMNAYFCGSIFVRMEGEWEGGAFRVESFKSKTFRSTATGEVSFV